MSWSVRRARVLALAVAALIPLLAAVPAGAAGAVGEAPAPALGPCGATTSDVVSVLLRGETSPAVAAAQCSTGEELRSGPPAKRLGYCHCGCGVATCHTSADCGGASCDATPSCC